MFRVHWLLVAFGRCIYNIDKGTFIIAENLLRRVALGQPIETTVG